MSKAKATSQNTNKDLSCLRCRKKKAKCSKTRPTCTRCERSNHPCEYPDAPPNLTDLSKKVLDLYDSLKDLEGEFLFKYIQQSTTDNEDMKNEDIEQENNNNESLKSPIPYLSLSSPTPPPPLLLNSDTNNNNQNIPTTTESLFNNDNMVIETTTDKKEVAWSMSYLPDGISIHATTHNMLEFLEFIDKFTRQCIYDFGMDSLSSYWNLDYHQDLIMELFHQQEEDEYEHHTIMNNNNISDEQSDINNNIENSNHINNEEDEEVDDFNEDYYLVTVPIFNTSHLLHSEQQKLQHYKNTTSLINNKKNESSSQFSSIDFQQLYNSLPIFLNYVHLKLEQYTNIKTPGVPYQILLIIEELKPYLIIPKNNSNNKLNNDDDENSLFMNQLAMMYILSSYLICKRIDYITNDENDNDDEDEEKKLNNEAENSLFSTWTEADLYYHLKELVVDTVLQTSPTYAACLSVLLLIWYNSLQNNSNEMDYYLINFAWQMFKYLTQYPLKSVENHIISASLIYLDIYAAIFRYHHTSISTSSHFFQELGTQLKSRIKLLCNDIYQSTSTTTTTTTTTTFIIKLNDDPNKKKEDSVILYKKQFVFIILESQLMLFLQQVLELFYINEDNNDKLDQDDNDDHLIVRKIDVDDVLTLVRDLEQWEQQLPSWATITPGKKKMNKEEDDNDDNKDDLIKIKIEDEENNGDNMKESNDRVTYMILELHLTLHFIKILLFRPFCTEFKDHGIEQTYTKTTFLDLSIHSADKISDYLILLDQQEEEKKKKKKNHLMTSSTSYYDHHQMRHWFFALQQIVLDVVKRVRHTFNSDQDILVQLDSIVNRLESVA